MKATTFNEKLIPQINRVLKFVLENPYSNFYKKKYNNLGIKEIKTYEDFEKIPFLTKDEILENNIEERTFVPDSEIKFYRFSSGTTNNRIIGITPFSYFNPEYSIYNRININHPEVNNIMLVANPLSIDFHRLEMISKKLNNIIITIGDPYKLKITASIIQRLKIQAIVASPTILDLLINELEKIHYEFKLIKVITLRGEFCSIQKADYFQSKFTHSSIYTTYGTTENGALGYQCKYLSKQGNPNKFHTYPYSMFEIVNNREVVSSNKSGEIIYTDLECRAMPYIRYKTNDIGLLHKQNCKCNHNNILSLAGRYNFDFLKFYGTVLISQKIESSIDLIREYFTYRFQMHVFETKISGKPKPRLALYLELKKKFKYLSEDNYFKERTSYIISNNLYLSSKKTLKQLENDNIFLPLEVVFTEFKNDNQNKHKNIISHIK